MADESKTLPAEVSREGTLPGDGNADSRDQILHLWQQLTREQKELLIPRLLYSTELGSRVRELGLAWRPAYIERERG